MEEQREKDYVLGTHDEEVARLGLQHRVWRARSLDAWRRAGFNLGQTLLDVGCGPGHAAMDLAEIVGPQGSVIAIDRSRRFLDALEATRVRRGLANLRAVELDLEEGELPSSAGGGPETGAERKERTAADGAWARWVFCFLKRPKALLERIHRALRPGAPVVLHEYFHYTTWRMAPRSTDHEEFVRLVMESWRANGGEPDIGLELPGLLAETGFEVESLKPIVDVVSPADHAWQWPKAFIEIGLQRLVDLGRVAPARSREILDSFAARERLPHTLMVTPAVLEIIARRR